jgi:hypothetical protein
MCFYVDSATRSHSASHAVFLPVFAFGLIARPDVAAASCLHIRPQGPLVLGLDDTIARRRGTKIKALGIYRDPVRSSLGHFVKTSGLR